MPLEGNPQVEDGYTRLANELFDAILAAPLSGSQQKVVFTVMRLTYGYNKREDAISYGQVAKATGLSRRSAVRSMQELLEAQVLSCRKVAPRQPCLWGIQKRYQLWRLGDSSDGAVTRPDGDQAVTSDEAVTRASDKAVTKPSDRAVTHQRQKDIKDNEKERARRDRRPPTPVPPAVTVYREVTSLNPQKSWYPRLAETVGEDAADLERWREVCMRWIGLGWKKTNVAVMLDYFGRHELPGTARGNGRDSPRADPAPLERQVADIPKGWLQEPFDPDEEPEL